ncbi:hypothetical protein ABXT05_25000, partial [Flavobacterium johnsoniae]
IDNWLRHIKDEYRLHDKYLNSITDETERFNSSQLMCSAAIKIDSITTLENSAFINICFLVSLKCT